MAAERKRQKIEHEKFIRAWQHAETAKQAAEELGIERRVAIQRAVFLRRHGVPLKRMPRVATPRVDWARLASLAEELGDE